MKKNLGNADRALRAAAVVALVTCSVALPLPLLIRVSAFGSMAAYLLFTVLAGTCLGYKLIGKSTCPTPVQR